MLYLKSDYHGGEFYPAESGEFFTAGDYPVR